MKGKGRSSTRQRETSSHDVDPTEPRLSWWGVGEPAAPIPCWAKMAGPYTTECMLLWMDVGLGDMDSAAEAAPEGADSSLSWVAGPSLKRSG